MKRGGAAALAAMIKKKGSDNNIAATMSAESLSAKAAPGIPAVVPEETATTDAPAPAPATPVTPPPAAPVSTAPPLPAAPAPPAAPVASSPPKAAAPGQSAPTTGFAGMASVQKTAPIAGYSKDKAATGTGAPKCTACAKSVYENEKILAVGRVWHKTCFTCGGTGAHKAEVCGRTLTRDGYLDHENQPYCNACHAKMFRPRGFGAGLSTDYGPASAADASSTAAAAPSVPVSDPAIAAVTQGIQAARVTPAPTKGGSAGMVAMLKKTPSAAAPTAAPAPAVPKPAAVDPNDLPKHAPPPVPTAQAPPAASPAPAAPVVTPVAPKPAAPAPALAPAPTPPAPSASATVSNKAVEQPTLPVAQTGSAVNQAANNARIRAMIANEAEYQGDGDEVDEDEWC